jgi:hypothetical protein
VGIQRLPLGSLKKKMPFGCGPRGEAQRIYKREGDGFPQVRAVMSLVSLRLPMVHLSTKNAQTMH